MKKIITLALFICLYHLSFAQTWTELNTAYLTNTGGNGGRGSASFSIAGKCYFVGGSPYFYETWAYDTLAGTWASLTSYPGTSDGTYVGFAVNGMGYVATGVGYGYQWDSTMWQYNPGGNSWAKMAHFPGQPRGYDAGFTLDGMCFVGSGIGNSKGSVGVPLNDFYEYNPATNAWKQIANYPGAGTQYNICFVIGDKAYVGGGVTVSANGYTSLSVNDDFWEYDTTSKVWTSIANFGGGNRAAATTFSTCNKGYVGLGYSDVNQQVVYNDFWEYDPIKNAWTQLANISGSPRFVANGFVMGKSFFTGLGVNAQSVTDSGIWESIQQIKPGFTSETSVCAGQPIAFTDTSNYSPDNWKWSFSGGTPDTSSSQNPVITYDTAGMFNVTLTAWNSCDSSSITYTNYITVNASPPTPVFPKDTSFCGNFSLTLNSGSTGFKYLWSTGDTTHNLTVTTLGSYWVSVSSNCDTANSDTINVVVDTNTILNIIPQAPFLCSGASAVLSVSGGGSGFTWSPSTGLSTTTGDSVTATPSATITYMVSGTDSIGCPGHGTDLVTLIPAPNKPTITIHWDTLISSATSDNQWNYENVSINGAIYPTLVVSGSTSGYSVTVTNEANGCTTTSDTSTTTGINQLSVISNQLSIYPNPFNNTIYVKINSAALNVNEWSLQLTDVLGRTVYAEPSLNYNNEIDLSNLSSGVYFITVINKTARAVFPVVKQN